MRLVISVSERLRLGMTEPGFSAGGSRSQRRRFWSFMSNRQPAKQSRLCRWVRLGPTAPADTPFTVWQPEQPLVMNRLAPWTAGSVLVVVVATTAGPACWLRTHVSKSVGVIACTWRRMLACEVPQYSAHWP